jgi:hypothetical protein
MTSLLLLVALLTLVFVFAWTRRLAHSSQAGGLVELGVLRLWPDRFQSESGPEPRSTQGHESLSGEA